MQNEVRNVLKAIENDEAHYPTAHQPIPPTNDPTEPNLMHFDRQRAGENECDGCGNDFGTRWPFGKILTIITDKSGSQLAHAHKHADCIHRAITKYGVDRL